MICKVYQNWLHLYGENELSPRRAKKLDRHLLRCPVCAGEKVKIEAAGRLITAAGNAAYTPPDPHETTRDIMGAVERLTAADEPLNASGAIGKRYPWPAVLSLPKVRLALAGVALAVVGIFAFQAAEMAHRISRLEGKIARRPETRTAFSSSNPMATKTLVRAGIRAMENTDRIYRDLPGDKVVIDKQTLRLLLKLLEDRLKEDETLLDYLRRNTGLLDDIDFSDGLKKDEIKRILKEKETILKSI